MPLTVDTLYSAVRHDELEELSPATIDDYGFRNCRSDMIFTLFGVYQALSKFITKEDFRNKIHEALIKKTLNETVEELTNKIPKEFQSYWLIFKQNGCKIEPVYIL